MAGEQTISEILQRAAATGELVSVIYHGGSQPGTVREIRPIRIEADHVWAYDGGEQAKKFFTVKIELPGSTSAPAYDPNAAPKVDSRTIKEAFESKVPDFQAMRWHVELAENQISLHRFLKNGKVRKSGAIVLRFDEFVVDSVLDEEGWLAGGSDDWIEQKRKSKRPYHVASPTYQSPGFADLSRAIDAFMAEATKHNPNPKPDK